MIPRVPPPPGGRVRPRRPSSLADPSGAQGEGAPLANCTAAFFNRQAWKFQAWLQGYNGGPLRPPTLRIHDKQMNQLRNALIASGLTPTPDPNREFFIGRNPTER